MLENAKYLKGIPGYIVQGRYDLLCPPIMAQSLSSVWKESVVEMVEEGGHSANSGPMRRALEKSITSMINQLT